MGCDIHSYAELRTAEGWKWVSDLSPADPEWPTPEVFPDRQYGLFGFLADVRNYSGIKPLSEPRGLPEDMSAELKAAEYEPAYDWHSASWFTLAELQAVDYDELIWDRRVTRQVGKNSWDGGVTTDDPWEGERMSLRHFLGEHYFERLDVLAKLGPPDDVRVVFWFDN